MIKIILLVGVFSLLIFGQSFKELSIKALNNEQIKASKLTYSSLQDDSSAIFRAYLPNLKLDYSMQGNSFSNSATPKTLTTASISSSVVLLDGLKRRHILSATDNYIKSSKYSLKHLENSLILQVGANYFNYFIQKAYKNAKTAQIQTIQNEVNRLNKLYIQGTIAKDELISLRASLQNAKIEMLSIDTSLKNFLNNINYLTKNNLNNLKYDLNIKKIILSDEAIDDNNIKSLEYTTKALQDGSKVILGDYAPTISASYTISSSEKTFDTADTTNTDQNTLALNLEWKIFSFGSTNKEYQSSQKQYLAQKANLELAKQSANNDIKNTKINYINAIEKIKLAKINADIASESFALVQKKYRNDIATNVAYINALKVKFNAIATYEASKYEKEYQKLQLIYYLGNSLQEYIQ